MQYRLKTGERVISFQAEKKGDHGITLSHDNCLIEVEYAVISGHHLHLVVNGSPVNVYVARDGNAATVMIRGIPYSIRDADILDTRARGKKSSQALPQDITPPMPSVVVAFMLTESGAIRRAAAMFVFMPSIYGASFGC